jgi:hypothetical protein
MYTAAECRRYAREDAREYAIRFPRRLPHPNYNVFLRLVYRPRDTGPWCLPDKKLVVPREKLERQRLKMLFFSSLMTTVEEVYLKNYIYREPINILEELNDQIYETLATVIPNMLRLARENLIKRTRLFLQMKSGHFEHLLKLKFNLNYSFYFACFLFHLLRSTYIV